jgi:hypothetical protein
LYKPEKSNDFRFLDRIINEQFQVGGTDVVIYKYLGPVNPEEGEANPSLPNNTNSIPELGIQDLIFMENRDRHYDSDVYTTRAIYTMQDLDFNLSQFGLFLQNDNILINFHLKNTIDVLGRKLMAGDVLELPHLKDEYALDDKLVALKRFYVVQSVTRPASGFSQTWYPHLLRAKCAPLVDSQEFKEILDSDSGNGDDTSLRDLISTYKQSIEINNQIVEQAELDAPLSGYETKHLYVLSMDNNGFIDVADASETDIDVSSINVDASYVLQTPSRNLYVGYLTGDGVPPNGARYGYGIEFPNSPVKGEFYLRTDHLPNRLYRYDGTKWIKFEDNVRMTLNNFGEEDLVGINSGKDKRLTQKTSFINNNNTATIAGSVVKEKQALSKALRPKADV